MITEQLMKPGRFDIRFKADAPAQAVKSVTLFDHIVITPSRIHSPTAYADADILAAAMWSGVVLAKPNPRTLNGCGLGYWLGSDTGAGDVLDTAVTQTAATLSTWITALLPSSVTAGTVTNTGSTLTDTLQWSSRREAIDYVCRALGAEWRINPDCTLDAAAATTLFASTPTAVIARRDEGGEGTLQGLRATDLTPATDATTYTTKVIVVAQAGDGAQVSTGSASTTAAYNDFHGNAVVMERLVNAPTTPDASADAVAQATLNLYSSVRKSIALTSDTYACPVRVKPGDWVYVYDPEAGLVDTANQITWRGGRISPVKLRVKGYTWPLEVGMGVYARTSAGVYTDLTDYVEWEQPRVSWLVGASGWDPEQNSDQLGTAYLGANPAVQDRVSAAPLRSWTPTWVGSGGNPANYTATGTYRIDGGQLKAQFKLTVAVGFTAGTGTYSVTGLPVNPVSGRASWLSGVARIYDASTGNIVTAQLLVNDSGVVTMRYPATAPVGAETQPTTTVPWTWALNDTIEADFSYPIS